MTITPNSAEPSPRSFRIDEELSRVLRSSSFLGSKQCQTLLRYLVEKSLVGQEGDGSLKERTIGIEVFGRKPDYDTTDDAIVRARVGEVRKRLAQFYQSPEGRDSSVQFDIPSGAYRLRFTFRVEKEADAKEAPAAVQSKPEAAPVVEAISEPQPAPSISGLPKPSRWRAWVLASVAACATVAVAWVFIPQWTMSERDLFWAPIFESAKPAVVCMGTAEVYAPSAAATQKALSLTSTDDLKKPIIEWSLPPLAAGRTLNADDFLINHRDYAAVGDIGAVVDVAQLLTAHHRVFVLRSGTNMPFEDLRGSPVVLTGGGSNYWSIDMTQNLPFFVDRGLRIRERSGQGRVWASGLYSDHTITEDYAIVSRLLNSKTGAPVITLAGITMCGTRAAGEFVTDPVQMRKLRSISRDALEHKNIEFVLHTNLVDCNPTSMDIVDLRTW